MIEPAEKAHLVRFGRIPNRNNLVEMPSRIVHVAGRQAQAATMDLRARLMIRPDAEVKLGEIDPTWHDHDAVAHAGPSGKSLSEQLDRLQYLMHAESKHSLLIVLQGLDASGKDGAIRNLLTAMNPMGCRLTGFKQPRREELDHDFLWRIHPHLPGKGEVSIFNRSHYEDVLVVRVHRAVPVEFWFKRYDLINDFERLVAVENNTTILKFFLHISKAEQLARFKQRLEDPTRQWKISESDYHEREYWDDYMQAFEDMLARTSTRHAPWFVIPANEKWFRDFAIGQIVARTLEDLDMKWPAPSVDLAQIRRRYHEAEMEEGDS